MLMQRRPDDRAGMAQRLNLAITQVRRLDVLIDVLCDTERQVPVVVVSQHPRHAHHALLGKVIGRDSAEDLRIVLERQKPPALFCRVRELLRNLRSCDLSLPLSPFSLRSLICLNILFSTAIGSAPRTTWSHLFGTGVLSPSPR